MSRVARRRARYAYGVATVYLFYDFVASQGQPGFGMNYQQHHEIVLAPIRTGMGLRAGANVGYLHYRREKGWLPF